MPKCSIIFDNKSNGIYYSGQTISGSLILDNEKTRKITSISLTFEGNSKCKWSKQESRYSIVKYRGREHFIKEVKELISSDIKGKEFEISKGLHEYPFSFKMSQRFPSSVEAIDTKFHWGGTAGLCGYIRYLLIFKIERVMSGDIKQEFPLTIIKKFDLNLADARFCKPIFIEDTKHFSLSSNPPFFMSIDAPISGFVCGEKAKFFVSYRNESNTDVTQTKVQLVKINTYHAYEPKINTKIGSEDLSSAIFPGVPKKSSKNIETQLIIPSVAPTSDGSSRVLSISYEIHISAIFGGFSSELTLKVPVIIGSVAYDPFTISKNLSFDDDEEDEIPEYDQVASPQVQSSRTPQQPNIRSIFTRGSNAWSLGPSTSTTFMQRTPVSIIPENFELPPPTYMEATSGRPLNNAEEKAANS